MNKRFTFVVLAALATAACGGVSTNQPAGSAAITGASTTALDGRSYDVALDVPGEPSQKDSLVFANGKFESTLCSARGFPRWTEYATRNEGDATEFRATTRHSDGATVSWKGTVKGDLCEGTATRTVNGKTDTGTFKGAARK